MTLSLEMRWERSRIRTVKAHHSVRVLPMLDPKSRYFCDEEIEADAAETNDVVGLPEQRLDRCFAIARSLTCPVWQGTLHNCPSSWSISSRNGGAQLKKRAATGAG